MCGGDAARGAGLGEDADPRSPEPGEATSRATEGARCDSWGHLCAFRRKMTAVWGVEGGRPHPGDSGVEGGLVRNESQQFTPLCIPIKA